MKNMVLIFLSLMCTFPAYAHHSFSAEFDGRKSVLLKGVVTKVEWINPHAWIHMEVINSDHKTQEWMIEAGSPNSLLRSVVDRNTLKKGTKIKVYGYQSKDGKCVPACKASGRNLLMPDGTKFFVGSTGVGAPRDGADPNEPAREIGDFKKIQSPGPK